MLATGLALAVLIGISLGLLGGGGSILTVPTLVYVMSVEPKAAIAMSLPVVGITALVGGVKHWRAGQVNLRIAIAFGIVAMAGSLAAAKAARLVPGVVQLTLLGLVMLVAAVMMMRRKTPAAGTAPRERHPVALGLVGLGVGALTGRVGIGGGFLFVPALVLFGGVPIKRAVGTSLIVIAMNTASAALGYRGQATVDWALVAGFTACAVAGSLVGARLVGKVSADGLRRGFAWFLIVIAAFVLWQNRAVLLDPRGSLRPASVQPRA
jgi:uncharacterized membrane protein YfcA